MKIEETTTIAEMIKAGENVEMTYYNSSYIERVGNIEYSVHNILYDYMEDIEPYLQTITLSDLEYTKYKYRPRLLAYDLYGSTDLYFLIMIFNNICDIKDFNIKKIKLLSRANLSIINKIFITEKDYLDRNRYLISTSEQSNSPISNPKIPETIKYDIYHFRILINDYLIPDTMDYDIDKICGEFINDINKISISQLNDYNLPLVDEEDGYKIFCFIPSVFNEEYSILHNGIPLIYDKEYALLINDEYIMFKLYALDLHTQPIL